VVRQIDAHDLKAGTGVADTGAAGTAEQIEETRLRRHKSISSRGADSSR